jgi:DNA-binding transcriptional regulator YiaG
MPTVNSEGQLSRELVRALRAERSQQAVSRRLGYSSNVVYPWESGQRTPKLGDFLRLVAFYGDDPPAAFGLLGVAPSKECQRVWNEGEIATVVRHLVGTRVANQLAPLIDVDRGTLSRWLDGATQPRVPEFLRLLEETTHRKLEFVSLLVDPRKLASVSEAYRGLTRQQALAYEHPASGLVLRALETQPYRRLAVHASETLARATGLRQRQVERLVALLEEAGLIRLCGGRYELVEIGTVDTSRDEKKSRAIKQFWSGVAHRRVAQDAWPVSALSSFNLASVSRETLAKIRVKHVQYFEEVRALVEADEDPTEVLLLNWQLLPMGDEAPAAAKSSPLSHRASPRSSGSRSPNEGARRR